MKTIIAAFSDEPSAQLAIDFLRSRQVPDIQMLTHQDGNLLDRLGGFDIPNDRAQLYAEVMRRGAVVVAARTADNDANQLANELDQMGSLDLDRAQTRWRGDGWTTFDINDLPYDATARTEEQALLRQESMFDKSQHLAEGRDLEVIEEKVAVGKREVPRGGVRVRTFVVERPVEEQVELREERINVQREAVNEAVSPSAADSTFTEEEFVVTARGEEAVVGKEARVVERVHVAKTGETRTETITETERRRDVEVEPIEEEAEVRRGEPTDPTIRRP